MVNYNYSTSKSKLKVQKCFLDLKVAFTEEQKQ